MTERWKLTDDEVRRLTIAVATVMKSRPLVQAFRVCKMDAEDVRQEAFLAGVKWLTKAGDRDEKTRFKFLIQRIKWDLRDLLRVKAGARRTPENRELFQSIEQCVPLSSVESDGEGPEMSEATGVKTFSTFGEPTRKFNFLTELASIICDAIDEARKL